MPTQRRGDCELIELLQWQALSRNPSGVREVSFALALYLRPPKLVKQRQAQPNHEDVDDGDGQQVLPAEVHELVVLEARERPADPDEAERAEADLGEEAQHLQEGE